MKKTLSSRVNDLEGSSRKGCCCIQNCSATVSFARASAFSRKIRPVKEFSAAFIVLAFFAGVNFCSAQTDSLISAATMAPAPSDVITFATGQAIQGHSTAGRFAPVTLNPLATAAIQLQFPTTSASTPVVIQALDGGTVGSTNQSATIGLDGTISFQFQAGKQPGLYRVLVIANGTASMVQFSVPSQ